MKYSINDFNSEFPDDEACLLHVFKTKHPRLKGYRRIKGRLCFRKNGKEIYPLVGTPFEHSRTPLRLWFYAVYLFSQSRSGVSAKELQRQLGVTYKCAWRIGKQIRSQMNTEIDQLEGLVECDEVYVGGRRRLVTRKTDRNKTPIFGMVERGGRVLALPVEDTKAATLYPLIKKHIKKHSKVITDGYSSYWQVGGKTFTHKSVNHAKWEYVRKERYLNVHTNTIEGFWSQVKRQIYGTHHSVARKYLPIYLGEISWRYNQHGRVLFPLLLEKVLT